MDVFSTIAHTDLKKKKTDHEKVICGPLDSRTVMSFQREVGRFWKKETESSFDFESALPGPRIEAEALPDASVAAHRWIHLTFIQSYFIYLFDFHFAWWHCSDRGWKWESHPRHWCDSGAGYGGRADWGNYVRRGFGWVKAGLDLLSLNRKLPHCA